MRRRDYLRAEGALEVLKQLHVSGGGPLDGQLPPRRHDGSPLTCGRLVDWRTGPQTRIDGAATALSDVSRRRAAIIKAGEMDASPQLPSAVVRAQSAGASPKELHLDRDTVRALHRLDRGRDIDVMDDA